MQNGSRELGLEAGGARQGGAGGQGRHGCHQSPPDGPEAGSPGHSRARPAVHCGGRQGPAVLAGTGEGRLSGCCMRLDRDGRGGIRASVPAPEAVCFLPVYYVYGLSTPIFQIEDDCGCSDFSSHPRPCFCAFTKPLGQTSAHPEELSLGFSWRQLLKQHMELLGGKTSTLWIWVQWLGPANLTDNGQMNRRKESYIHRHISAQKKWLTNWR